MRASTDGLTGLLNRRSFDERLGGEVSRAIRHGRALALAIIDIDHFKRVNDRHGHLAGDAVLSDVARQLSALARDGDIVARIGGEEFAWIMPETPSPVAFDVADRVRAAVAATRRFTSRAPMRACRSRLAPRPCTTQTRAPNCPASRHRSSSPPASCASRRATTGCRSKRSPMTSHRSGCITC